MNRPKVLQNAFVKLGYLLETPCIRQYSTRSGVKICSVRTISREGGEMTPEEKIEKVSKILETHRDIVKSAGTNGQQDKFSGAKKRFQDEINRLRWELRECRLTIWKIAEIIP